MVSVVLILLRLSWLRYSWHCVFQQVSLMKNPENCCWKTSKIFYEKPWKFMKKLRIFLGKNGDDFEFEIISFIYFIQTVEFQLIRIQFLFPKVSCWLLFVWMENTYLKKGNLTNIFLSVLFIFASCWRYHAN